MCADAAALAPFQECFVIEVLATGLPTTRSNWPTGSKGLYMRKLGARGPK